MKNKYKTGFLLVVVIFITMAVKQDVVKAEIPEFTITQNYVNGYFHAHKNGNSFTKYGQLASWKSNYDGSQAYCIAPGEPFSNSAKYKAYSYDNTGDLVNRINSTQKWQITQEKLNQIQLYAYYGYGYDNHNTTKYLVATQMLIWRTVDPDQVFTNTNCTVTDCKAITDAQAGVENEMNTIRRLADDHYTIPSFDGETKDMTMGGSVTYLDTFGVLSNFSVEECLNCTASINNNVLTITPKDKGNYSASLTKKSNNYSSNMVFAINSSSQNEVVAGNIDPIYVRVSGTTYGGSITISKTDEDTREKLNGAVFEVINSSNNIACTMRISNGKGKCDNLALGKYTIKEKQAPVGYVLSEASIPIEITTTNTNITLNVTNKKIKGNLKLYKKSSENIPTDASLKNAVYNVYNSDGSLYTEISTNTDGYASLNDIPYGDYYIIEKTSSEGYDKDTNRYDFSVEYENQVITINSIEPLKKFRFDLIKVISNGTTGVIQSEPNAKFDIFLKSQNVLVTSITTDSKGKANVMLAYGKYSICQSKGDGNSQIAPCFEINIDNNDIEKIVNNGPIEARLKLLKIDKDSGDRINVSGIKFKIKDKSTNEYVCQTTNKVVCTFETNEEGIVYTPLPLSYGNYILEEVDQELNGYLWNQEELEFSINGDSSFIYDDTFGILIQLEFNNKRVEGEINIEKLGELFIIGNNSYHYEEKSLTGVTFGLFAKENIYFNGKLIYNKGDLVSETLTEKGKATFTNLYLGSYIIKELKTLDDYILDQTEYYIDLKYKDQYTDKIIYNLKLTNYLKKGNIKILKTDKLSNNPVPNTIISIYTIDDELIFTGTTKNDGNLNIENLKVGKYYAKEIKAKEGYILNEEKVYFEIKDNTELIELKIKNMPITGKLIFKKVDIITKQPLANTEIAIYDTDGNLYTKAITNESGQVIIENIPYGKYYIVEIKAPDGYMINSEKLYFEIKDNNEEVKATMSDEPIIITEVPKTYAGFFNNNNLPEFVGCIIILLGSGAIIYGKNKKR